MFDCLYLLRVFISNFWCLMISRLESNFLLYRVFSSNLEFFFFFFSFLFFGGLRGKNRILANSASCSYTFPCKLDNQTQLIDESDYVLDMHVKHLQTKCFFV